jgi:DNA-binding response OmpR family regulator
VPRSVLVIDDEVAVSRAIAIRLRAAGFTVSTAESGLSGLEAARTSRPDLIVLDVRMADIDGFEVQARLRHEARLASIPIIMLSASVQDSARQAALAAGAFAYLTKPYDAKELVATITHALQHTSESNPAASLPSSIAL